MKIAKEKKYIEDTYISASMEKYLYGDTVSVTISSKNLEKAWRYAKGSTWDVALPSYEVIEKAGYFTGLNWVFEVPLFANNTTITVYGKNKHKDVSDSFDVIFTKTKKDYENMIQLEKDAEAAEVRRVEYNKKIKEKLEKKYSDRMSNSWLYQHEIKQKLFDWWFKEMYSDISKSPDWSNQPIVHYQWDDEWCFVEISLQYAYASWRYWHETKATCDLILPVWM